MDGLCLKKQKKYVKIYKSIKTKKEAKAEFAKLKKCHFALLF